MENPRLTAIKKKLETIIDFSNPDFCSQVNQLAGVAGLQDVNHPSSIVLLQAIIKYVETALDKNQEVDKCEETEQISLDNVGLIGMTKPSSPNVNNARKILQLLNLEQLRRLQTQINVLTVDVQKITADPKTDLNLGRVGR